MKNIMFLKSFENEVFTICNYQKGQSKAKFQKAINEISLRGKNELKKLVEENTVADLEEIVNKNRYEKLYFVLFLVFLCIYSTLTVIVPFFLEPLETTNPQLFNTYMILYFIGVFLLMPVYIIPVLLIISNNRKLIVQICKLYDKNKHLYNFYKKNYFDDVVVDKINSDDKRRIILEASYNNHKIMVSINKRNKNIEISVDDDIYKSIPNTPLVSTNALGMEIKFSHVRSIYNKSNNNNHYSYLYVNDILIRKKKGF